MCLEGGYNLISNGLCASECVSVLLGKCPESLPLKQYNGSAIETLKCVIGFQSTNWPNLKFDFDLPESLI
ncbi:unnamed protein product [Medioppia subpectinata]|uniref:Histone deacetylase n=2 Tax=Medioppia subpectinata TaxID=1979941 RepID=A0A7R9LPR6_9ACAR|nr:unnamed protein product [Medioppia subpectinata]CAG2120648.1 unnamed protein product [Medioppia subpectinata]